MNVTRESYLKRNVIREYLNACDAWFISWGMRDSWIICVWSGKFRFPEVSPTMTYSKRDAWILLKFVREKGSPSPLCNPPTRALTTIPWLSKPLLYVTIARHVLHHSLHGYLSDSIKAIQRQAMEIIIIFPEVLQILRCTSKSPYPHKLWTHYNCWTTPQII